jgi:hypothetical protein
MMRRRRAADRRPPAPVIAFIVVVGAVAVTSVALSWRLVGFPRDTLALLILCSMGVLSVLLREPDVGSRVGFSFLSIIVIACIVIVGPVGCALVGALSMGLGFGQPPLRVRIFNSSMSAVLGAIGGLVYILVGGARDLTQLNGAGALILHVGVPLMLADLAQMLCNAALMAGIFRIDRGVPFRRFFVQMVTNSGVAYLGYGFIGFLFVILWIPADVGPFSAVLILAPLFVARWAFVQFGEEQRAHESALSALVTAVETKDPFSIGHSSRVAQLAEWMAEPLSLGAHEAQALRFAAMLHDVGKVGLPTKIVVRPGAMTSDDLDLLALHPQRGVALVEGIDFLKDSLEGIHHHHERFDGRGYPAHLGGEAIPLSARIIAVADAFDSLTMDRPHRRAVSPATAVDQLRLRSGSQFDPVVVNALAKVLERREWRSPNVDADTIAGMAGYFDHDDPLASDLATSVGMTDTVPPE